MLASALVFVGAGIGGVARHLLNGWIVRAVGADFPVGLLVINVLGSAVMGLAVGWFAFKGAAAQDVRLFLTTGVLGGFTTFSAFSLEAVLLYERGEPWLAIAYVLASVIFSIIGLCVGMWAMRTAV